LKHSFLLLHHPFLNGARLCAEYQPQHVRHAESCG
jgi:hypothetical protein